MRKRDRKSARKSAPGQPFRKGRDSRRGRGPKKGSGGRPPLEFKKWLLEWFDGPRGRQQLKRMALREASVMNRLLGYAYGLPVQEIGGEGGGPLTVRIIHEYQGGK